MFAIARNVRLLIELGHFETCFNCRFERSWKLGVIARINGQRLLGIVGLSMQVAGELQRFAADFRISRFLSDAFVFARRARHLAALFIDKRDLLRGFPNKIVLRVATSECFQYLGSSRPVF